MASDGLHYFATGFGSSLELPPEDTGVSEESKMVTAFGHTYGLLIIDEVAQFRNVKKETTALKGLRERAFGAIGMTATPIVNSPMVSAPSHMILLMSLTLRAGCLASRPIAARPGH